MVSFSQYLFGRPKSSEIFGFDQEEKLKFPLAKLHFTLKTNVYCFWRDKYAI